MRNGIGMAIAAAFLVAGPASAPAMAQARRAPMAARSARPMRRPARPAPVSRPRQLRPPARILYVRPAVHPAPAALRPAFHPAQPVSPSPFLASGLSGVSFAGEGAGTGASAGAGFGAAPIPLGQLLNPTPGLGFDFSHLAAVNSGLAVRAFIDPVTQHELAITRQLPQEQPIGFSTYFPAYAYGGETPVVSGASQPQVIVVQQPVAQPAPAVAPAPAPAPAAAAAPPLPPLPVGTLDLVRRDGSVIHAIAFSRVEGRVVYITAGGLRRSIALDQLNVRATEERNAEHGTILHLSE